MRPKSNCDANLYLKYTLHTRPAGPFVQSFDNCVHETQFHSLEVSTASFNLVLRVSDFGALWISEFLIWDP
jgi:hypothetical protein